MAATLCPERTRRRARRPSECEPLRTRPIARTHCAEADTVRNQPDNFDPMLLHEPNVGVALMGRRHPFRDNTIGTGDVALRRDRPRLLAALQTRNDLNFASLRRCGGEGSGTSMATRPRGQRRQDSQAATSRESKTQPSSLNERAQGLPDAP